MAIKRPMHGIQQAQKWPMCGNCSGLQQAGMWQSTGTQMAIKRRIYGSEQAQKWPICGNQQFDLRHDMHKTRFMLHCVNVMAVYGKACTCSPRHGKHVLQYVMGTMHYG